MNDVVLNDVEDSNHLREYQNFMTIGFQLRQQFIDENKFA